MREHWEGRGAKRREGKSRLFETGRSSIYRDLSPPSRAGNIVVSRHSNAQPLLANILLYVIFLTVI